MNKKALQNNTPKALKKFEELEFFTKAGQGEKLHYQFLKNFNSEETRKAYFGDLKHFFNFYKMAFKKSIRHPREIEKYHIVAYKDFLIDCGGKEQDKASNLTVRRKLATLSSYFKFMQENHIIKTNPLDGIKRPKKSPNKGTECLSEQQVRLLLDYLDTELSFNYDFKNIMHRTLIYTLFYTGIRVSECIKLTRADYFIYNAMPAFKIKAKGGLTRIVPIHESLKIKLEEYFRFLKQFYREKKWGPFGGKHYLFFSLMNNRSSSKSHLSRYGVYKILNKRAFESGIRQDISPHSARATLITSLLDQGHDLYKVSLSVGHANPETTKIYDKRNRSLKDNAILDINY